ncbi:pentatricopeptide repeat-containing protein At1g12620-like [Lotus japonicus]|uniref:pentatricopeptide repeat-containing protein At1g12620-like n=1 Tax=Lotus japonicus TaxID=34305 RepID=UPI00258B35D0|nr:pentatricopeptide repeat-containing protein At1g12620-like [Lotus japonicus]
MIRGFAAAAASGNLESKPAEKKVGEALKAMTTDEKPPSLISSNAVVIKGMFGEGKMRREAEEVLEEMMSQKRLSPDSVTYTSLIHLLCHQLQINKAYDVLTEMIDMVILMRLIIRTWRWCIMVLLLICSLYLLLFELYLGEEQCKMS